MKTMSDFIMEQDISTSGINADVEIMESFMKLNAIAAVAECYCEHAVISAFAAEAGLNVFTESDDSIGKKMWTGIKEFFSNLWEWLKAIVKGIINIFTKSSLEKCIAELEARREDDKSLNDIEPIWVDANKVLDLVEKFGDAVKKGSEGFGGDETIKYFKDEAEKFLKAYKEGKKDGFTDGDRGKGTYYTKELLDVLKRMQKANIPSRGSKLLKEFGFTKDKFKNENGKVDKDQIKDLKKAANLLAKAYDKYCDATVKMVRKAIKKDIKADNLKDLETKNARLAALDKEGKKTSEARAEANAESYVENSDGYFFL